MSYRGVSGRHSLLGLQPSVGDDTRGCLRHVSWTVSSRNATLFGLIGIQIQLGEPPLPDITPDDYARRGKRQTGQDDRRHENQVRVRGPHVGLAIQLVHQGLLLDSSDVPGEPGSEFILLEHDLSRQPYLCPSASSACARPARLRRGFRYSIRSSMFSRDIL